MPDPVDPVDPTEATFEALRLPRAPLAPRPGFAAELRGRLEAALTPADPPGPTRPTTTTTTEEDRPVSTTETTADPATTETTVPITPYLIVPRAAEAIAWYTDVLGAFETSRFVGDDDRVGHAELRIGAARLYLADEFPESDLLGPAARGGTSITLHLEVVDVDHTHRLAVDAGARSEREPADQGHGSRTATIVDPFGHRWLVAQPVDAERAARAEADRGVGGDGNPWAVTGRQPVEPGYLVLRTGDLDRARAFYGALFDWEVEPGNVEGGGHVANTRFPLGFLAGEIAGDGDATRIYFRVDDLAPYAERVTELGGRVLERNEYPSGGNAECLDDQGYRFDLWKPAPGY